MRGGERFLQWWNEDLGWLQGSVASVVSKGGPRPSAALTRGRYTLPHNIINPFQPVGGPSEETKRTWRV